MRRVFRIPFSRARIEREIDEELAFHLETRIERLVAQGWTPDNARREALRQLGDIAAVRRDVVALDTEREATERRATIVSDIRQDLGYGVRTFRRNAALTVLVIGGLALGIGANTAIYSVIDAILLRQLPVSRPDELIAVGDPDMVESSGQGMPGARSFSYPLYRDVRDHNQVFTDVLATGRAGRLDVYVGAAGAPDGIRVTGEPEHPHGRFVSGNYFSVLGLRPSLGRSLDSTSDRREAEPQVMISHGYWTRRFESDSSILGRALLVNGVSVTVIGVGPRGFSGEVVGASADIWLPIGTRDRIPPADSALGDRRKMWLLLIGRAKPDVTVETAKAQLTPLIRSSIFSNLRAEEIATLEKRGLEYFVSSGARGLSSVRVSFQAPLITLMAGVALLLLIVCVNVANLLLARGIARQREMSLRLAIGANRSRIVRQLLIESLLLAIVSGAAAVLVGWWGSVALVTLASDGTAISLPVTPSVGVVAFTLLLSIGSVILFGLVPALRTSRVDLAVALRAQARSLTQRSPFGVVLIAGQVALSLVLLAGAWMTTRSVRAALSTNLGFDRDHLIAVDIDVVRRRLSVERVGAYAEAVRERVASVPGVAAVSYSENGLFTGTEWTSTIQVAGFTPRDDEDLRAANDYVGPGYARAIGARLVAGRDIEPHDRALPMPVAMVNEAFARFYFPNRNPIGQVIRMDDDLSTAIQIVGVIADLRSRSVDAPQGRYARRMYFLFVRQSEPTNVPGHLRVFVRAKGEPAALVKSVRGAVAAIDPAVSIDEIQPLVNRVRSSIREERLVARIATALGALALVLAAIGLYGVTSYSIARRTSEIGIRVALGARTTDVARLVFGGALVPVLIGAVVGVPLAMAAMKLLRSHLPNIVPTDPLSVVGAIAVLVATSVIASAAPARRALRIDPVTALRDE
jgi:predicted permease